MTMARPHLCDDVEIAADLVEINRFFMVVRDRATGREHSFDPHLVLIGSSASGDCYTVTVPAWLAHQEGIDAR
jgi:hypothetical protein